MPIDNKKGLKKSQKSSDGHRTGSKVAQPDTAVYQNLDHDEHDATIPSFEADATQDFSQMGALFAEEKLNIDLILKIERVVKS